jgi:hypothetical protein
VLATVAAAMLGGCQDVVQKAELPREFPTAEYLAETVGTKAYYSGADPILVQGYGLVTGLRGTGSRTLPPWLKDRMMKVLGQHRVPNPEAVLADPNTAVVYVSGYIPTGAQKGERFDLAVAAVPGTETTSLEGGYLMPMELARMESSRTGPVTGLSMATGSGEMFVSPFTAADRVTSPSSGVRPIGPNDTSAPTEPQRLIDPRLAWVIGGGETLQSRRFLLNLLEPSERLADQIVSQVNARFPNTAKGRVQAGIVDFRIPAEYAHQKQHFLDVMGAVSLIVSPTRREERQRLLIAKLIEGPDRVAASAALEAFGRDALPLIEPLARHADPAVRFYAADLMARLNQPNAIGILEPFLRDDASPFQEKAVTSLAELRGIAAGTITRGFDASSPLVRIAAYTALRRIAPTMLQDTIAIPDRMELATIRSKAEPFVYVGRSLEPRVVVFGDVRLKPPFLIDTERMLVTAREGESVVTLVNKQYGPTAKVLSTLAVADVVGFLASPPRVESDHPNPRGLDLSYADVVAFLDRAKTQGALSSPLVYEPIRVVAPGLGDQGDLTNEPEIIKIPK